MRQKRDEWGHGCMGHLPAHEDSFRVESRKLGLHCNAPAPPDKMPLEPNGLGDGILHLFHSHLSYVMQ